MKFYVKRVRVGLYRDVDVLSFDYKEIGYKHAICILNIFKKARILYTYNINMNDIINYISEKTTATFDETALKYFNDSISKDLYLDSKNFVVATSRFGYDYKLRKKFKTKEVPNKQKKVTSKKQPVEKKVRYKFDQRDYSKHYKRHYYDFEKYKLTNKIHNRELYEAKRGIMPL